MTLTKLKIDGYEATQDGDTLIIHNVPIFCETEREGIEFDSAWVNSAFKYAMQQQRDGYYPPLFAKHHKPGQPLAPEPIAAGKFNIHSMKRISYKGKIRTALIADLHVNNPMIAEDLINGKLPYLSVEIDDVTSAPAIDGLALLDHSSPFLELPLLMVNNISGNVNIPNTPDALFSKWDVSIDSKNGRLLMCFDKESNKAHILLDLHADCLQDDDKSGSRPIATQNIIPDNKGGSMTKKVKMEKHDDKDKSEKMEAEGGIDTASVIAAIESGSIPIADFDAIATAMAAYTASTVTEEEVAPAPTPDEVMEKEEDDDDDDKKRQNFAKMQGRIDGLEAKDKARDEAESVTNDVSLAFEKLRNRPLGALDELKTKLSSFRTKHGHAAFEAYVSELDATVASIPIKGVGKEQNFENSNLSEEVMAFHELGSDALEHAVEFARQHEHLKTRGAKTSLKRYLEINMRPFAKKASVS